MIKEIFNCPECRSDTLVEGTAGGFGDAVFDPGHKKWSAIILLSNVNVRRHKVKCCTVCGLAWTDLNAVDLRKFIINKCDEKFAYKIYNKTQNSEGSKHPDCMNCCTNCGFITTLINPERLNSFLLKYGKPGYLKSLYSHDK